MWKAARDLMASKKFLVLIFSIVAYGASRVGLDVPADFADKALALVGAWIIGQGVADNGKSAAETSRLPAGSPE
jgi:hypothetical protein